MRVTPGSTDSERGVTNLPSPVMAKKLAEPDFLDLAVGQGVQVDAVGEAFGLGLGAGHQAGGVVAATLAAPVPWGAARS